MTTIAYKAGVLAADTLISYGTYTNGNRNKITDCGDFYVAMAGAAWLKEILEGWVMSGADPHECPSELLEHEDTFCAFIMHKNGRLYDFTKAHLVPVDADYAAIGSGGPMALGAMAYGADAYAAVAAACRHDKASGGDITVALANYHDGGVPAVTHATLN